MTDISEKQALLKRLKKDRSRLSLLSVLIPLAFIFSAASALGQGSERQISADVAGSIATLESIGSDVDDVLVFKVKMSDASLHVSHTSPGGQESEAILRLQRVEVFENDDGTLEKIGTYQIADVSYSARTYSTVLDGVDGKGLEVEWHLEDDSKLELKLELFDEKLVHDGIEYGSTSALMKFEFNYPEEGDNLEISLEAEVLASHADLSQHDGNSFLETSSNLPTSAITFGFGKVIYHEDEIEEVAFTYGEIEGGVAFTVGFQKLGEFSWDGFLSVDILPFGEEDRPVGDPVVFGATLAVSAIAVIILKLKYLKLGGGLTE